jgi:putative membrane protein
MVGLLVSWVVTALALLIVAYVFPGFKVDTLKAALIAAIVIGLVNATLGLVLKIVTFPLTVLTLGLFWFVINALMLMLAAKLVDGFSISGFWVALFGGIVLSIVNAMLKAVIPGV